MSWRSNKSNNYNRTEEKEETFFWLDLYYSYDPYEWTDWDEFGWGIAWWEYDGGGYVANMDEYHQMHLLTLLRKLGISNARNQAINRGW